MQVSADRACLILPRALKIYVLHPFRYSTSGRPAQPPSLSVSADESTVCERGCYACTDGKAPLEHLLYPSVQSSNFNCPERLTDDRPCPAEYFKNAGYLALGAGKLRSRSVSI